MTDPLVEMRGVRKQFVTRHVLALDEETRKRRFYKRNLVDAAMDVSFAIQPGEIFGLLGPNGAGKTTTVKMISGLVKPDAGQVFVAGMDVERKRKQILRQVGVVLEGTRTSLWPLTPLENLMYYGNLKNVRGAVLHDRAHDLLDFIGLQDKKNIQVRRLSRGQKQKLAICIALIADPRVLLLDEPTTGLDVQSSRAIKDRIIEMTHGQGRAVLVTTHDMHVAQELCDRVGIINKGRLVACKPMSELLELFSEHVLVFKLDAPAGLEALSALPGVLSAEEESGNGETSLVLSLAMDEAERSAGFYAVTRVLEAQGRQVLAVQQRQQNLESVFLRITGQPLDAGDDAPGPEHREQE